MSFKGGLPFRFKGKPFGILMLSQSLSQSHLWIGTFDNQCKGSFSRLACWFPLKSPELWTIPKNAGGAGTRELTVTCWGFVVGCWSLSIFRQSMLIPPTETWKYSPQQRKLPGHYILPKNAGQASRPPEHNLLSRNCPTYPYLLQIKSARRRLLLALLLIRPPDQPFSTTYPPFSLGN